MKTKGITIWERHAEKIVLAIGAVVAVGLAAVQFIGQPNAVSSGGREIAPGEIDELLEQEAEQLLGVFSDRAPAGVEIEDPVPAADNLLAKLDAPVSPDQTLPPIDVALAPSPEGGQISNVEFPVPDIDAPEQVVVLQYADTLEESMVEQIPELQSFFPDPSQPRDLIFATAFARFDLADLRREFKQQVGEEAAVIPSSWYNDRPSNIVDVVIEREELVDGQWTDRVVLDSIPGQYTFRTAVQGEPDASLRASVLDQLADPAAQVALVRPAFYRTVNETWSIPDFDKDHEEVDLGLDEQIRTLRNRLKRDLARRADLLEKLEEAGGTRDEGPGAGSGGGGGDGGGPGGRREPPGGGGGKRAPPGSGAGFGGAPGETGKRGVGPGERDERKIKQLNKRIDGIDRRIARTKRELRELGVDPDAEVGGATANDPIQLLQSDELVIWGHDLTAKPRHTYRYRFTVKVFNPFFGKKRSLVEEQQHLAEPFTIDSEPSAWSEPIRIDRFLHVYIVDADPPGTGAFGAATLGRAKAEVYRFYNGNLWLETFLVSPGDYIGGVRTLSRPDGGESVEIDFTTDLFVLDIVEDVDAAARRGAGLRDRSPARVLLQDYRTGDILPLLDPEAEERSGARDRLRDRVETTL